MKGIFGTYVFCLLVQTAFSISHRTTLIWTEKEDWGAVKISSVAGDPEDWFKNGSYVLRGGSAPLDFFSRILSHRVALAFRYSTQQLFFSDRGFKSISRLRLKVVYGDHYSYNASIETVYSGTSVLVYGIAVDWLSGSIYWTDAHYNWITVGSTTKYRIFRHLVVTGLDLPMGIAVYPKKGLMFWTDWGVQPKIERSNLVGTDRKVLLTSGLWRPQGLTIDYDENRLYWVDDETDTVEMADLDGGQRSRFNAKEPGHYEHSLFGIAVFNDFVFVTDQLAKDIRAYRKSSKQYIGRFILDRSVPYDIMMYAESRQEEMDNAECKTMGCQHLCISSAGGHGMCMCSQDFDLQADNKTCKRNLLAMQPSYIYAVGNGICKTRINSPDTHEYSILDHLQCFEKDVGHVRALGFHSYAQLLFYSDIDKGTIHRKRMAEADEDAEVIAVQTGHVTGIAVDWITGHLYWTDELYGHIMVSDLTGRYQHVILKGLNKPRGIAVDPAAGFLYWCAEGAIYRSALDGSAAAPFISEDVNSPTGIVLDIVSKRLYWTDVDHIESVLVTNSFDRRKHFGIPSESSDTLNDVTIYQDFMAWTSTRNMVYFGYKDSFNSLRVVKHENVTAVYDIVAYDTHLQPISEGPCDNENGDCSQLCFPNGTMGRRCGCAFPFYLDKDGKTCLSDFDHKGSHFLLFVDPYQKQAYQFDAEARDGQLRGIILQSAAFPDRIEYDERDDKIYWYDPTENVISRQSMDGKGKEVLHSLPPGHTLGSMVLHSKSRQLFYTDAASADIVTVSLDKNETRKFHSGNFLPGSLAVDNHNGRIFWAEKMSQKPCTIFHRYVDGDATKVTEAKISVVTQDDVKGIAVNSDGNYLIWWTSKHVKGTYLNESGSNVAAIIRSGEDNYTSAAVADNWLYFTTWTSKTVLMINLLHPAKVAKLSTNFTRITDIRAYKETRHPPTVPTAGRTKPTPPSPPKQPVVVKTAPSLGGQSKPEPNLTIFGSLAAGLVGVMILILLLVFVVIRRRRRKRSNPTPPPVAYASPAHDNPTYMSRDEVREQAVSLGGATAAARQLPVSPPAEKVPIDEESEEKRCGSSTDDVAGASAPSDIAMSVIGSGDTVVSMEANGTHREDDCAKLVVQNASET